MLLNLNKQKEVECKKNKVKSRIKKISNTLLYFLLFIFLIINLSSIKKQDNQLLVENKKLYDENKKLVELVDNKINLLEEKYDLIYKMGLNISKDTIYHDTGITTINDIIDEKLKKINEIEYHFKFKIDSMLNVPVFSPVTYHEFDGISDYYGWRKHPILNVWVFHNGVDILARQNTNILSTANGYVLRKTTSKYGYGNSLVIDHNNGFKTLYAHLDVIYVNVGDTISRGQKIGSIGNTGLSTGIHLHYEILKNDINIDPMNYMFLNYDFLQKK